MSHAPRFHDYLHDLFRHAKSFGADAADGLVVESAGLHAAMRQGVLSDLERSETTEIGLRVFVGKRQACLATTDLAPAQFPALAERAVSMARMAPEDPYAGPAESGQTAINPPALDLADPAELPAEALIDAARTMDAAASAHPQITNVEEASASANRTRFLLATSNGFSGGYETTAHSRVLQAIAGTGTGMVRDYDFAQSVYAADLRAAEDVAKGAIERTVSRLDARKLPTPGAVPVVFAPRVARGLVGNFLGAISGAAIARKSSFLLDALGKEIFSPAVTIVEDPHIRRGLRSKPFDGEGLPTLRRNLVDRGRLTTWMMNCAAARQLGMASTGHASRGAGGVPGITAHNIALQPGTLSPEALIADIASGFYVTETMGFGVNTMTGDFSQGAAGFWIEKGSITFPVHEMTIAGNLTGMFRALVPANDFTVRYGIDSPTLRVDGMTVAGA